eukprot:COSAG01_NODE_6939_length_3431_cov_3.279712_3_plen_755_part_00
MMPSPPATGGAAALRAELAALGPRALCARAEEVGVSEGALDAAVDGAAVIELIMAKKAVEAEGGERVGEEEKEEERGAPLRSEPLALKPRALQKCAEAAGVTEEELDGAGDNATVVALTLGRLRVAQSEVAAQQAEQQAARRETLRAAAGRRARCRVGPKIPKQQPVLLAEQGSLNEPGHWNAMISYTQRNSGAKLLAAELYASLEKRGLSVWLDVKMPKLNEAAMQEAAQHSSCIIAVISGVERAGDPDDSAYFKRDYCVKGLHWARAAGVPIQPVIMPEDKQRIGEFLAQAPPDLKEGLAKADFIHLDRSRIAYWETGIDELIKSMQDLTGLLGGPEPEPEPEHGDSGLRRIHSGDGSGWAGQSDSAVTIFGSMRFPVPPEALALQAALQQEGITLTIVNMSAGQDISAKVFEAIERADFFLVFGTHHYGEDTGNPASSCREAKFAENLGKRIILLRMIPFEQEFDHIQARVMFRMNQLTLEWQPGTPMPPTLPADICKALASGESMSAASPEPEQEPAVCARTTSLNGELQGRRERFRRSMKSEFLSEGDSRAELQRTPPAATCLTWKSQGRNQLSNTWRKYFVRLECPSLAIYDDAQTSEEGYARRRGSSIDSLEGYEVIKGPSHKQVATDQLFERLFQKEIEWHTLHLRKVGAKYDEQRFGFALQSERDDFFECCFNISIRLPWNTPRSQILEVAKQEMAIAAKQAEGVEGIVLVEDAQAAPRLIYAADRVQKILVSLALSGSKNSCFF